MVQEALPQQRLSKIHQSLVKFQCFHGFPLRGRPRSPSLASLRQFTLSCREATDEVENLRSSAQTTHQACYARHLLLKDKAFLFSLHFIKPHRDFKRSYLRRRSYHQQHQRRGHGAADPVNERR